MTVPRQVGPQPKVKILVHSYARYRAPHARMTPNEHSLILFLRQGGHSIAQICDRVARSSSMVKVWLARPFGYQKPPRKTSASVLARARCVRALCRATVTLTSGKKRPESCGLNQIRSRLYHKHGYSVSRQTVYRDIKRLGGVSRVRPRTCSSDPADFSKRLLFTRIHRIGSKLAGFVAASNIIFSDEKIFTCNDLGGRRVYCFDGDRPPPREFRRWSPRVMVWGAIGVGFKCFVILTKPKNARGDDDEIGLSSVNGERYRKFVLPKFFREVQRQLNGKKYVFMQDGARCHTCHQTMRYLQNKGVPVLENWPPRSPDLNPIENLWAIIADMVTQAFPEDVEALTARLNWAFENVDQNVIDKLVLSFNERCTKVCNRQGHW